MNPSFLPLGCGESAFFLSSSPLFPSFSPPRLLRRRSGEDAEDARGKRRWRGVGVGFELMGITGEEREWGGGGCDALVQVVEAGEEREGVREGVKEGSSTGWGGRERSSGTKSGG